MPVVAIRGIVDLTQEVIQVCLIADRQNDVDVQRLEWQGAARPKALRPG